MAETDLDRGPVSRGGIAPRPLFAVGAVLLGSFLANFDSRLTTVGLPDLRGAFSLGFDEGAWLSTAATAPPIACTRSISSRAPSTSSETFASITCDPSKMSSYSSRSDS